MKKYLLLVIALLTLSVQISFAKDYTVHKFPSGQVLIVNEVHDNPIVTIDTWVKTGSINEDDFNNGVAHFLEHMFFKGTQKYPTGKFDQILESKGAITNAATSKDFTHYYIVIPSKDFNLAMELHSDMLLNPVLPRNELEMERKVVLEEIARGDDNPDNILYKQMNAGLYKDHPYKREVIGTSKIIETITREEMLKFYNTWYNPGNMITVVSGDVNTNDVIKSVEENFKISEYKKAPKVKYKDDPIKIKIPPAVKNMNTQTGYLLIGFRGVKPKNKKDSAALDVLATILGNGKSSRLYQIMQEQKQITTSVSSGHIVHKDDSLFYIKAKFPPDKQEEVENTIKNELKIVMKNPVSKEEINKAKNIIKRDTLYSRESVSNIANELGYVTLLTDKPSYYDTYLKDVEKVKPKDLITVANKYLDYDKASVSYILPDGMKVKSHKEGKLEDVKLTGKHYTTPLHDFGNKIYPENNNAKLISQNGDTKKYLLDNGLTLLITQNKSNDIISINMFSKGGFFQELEMEKRGVGNLLSEMLLKKTKNLSQTELSNILDENGIEISSQVLPDAFSTSIKMTKNEFNTGLELFDEVINNCIFEEDALNSVKNKKYQTIKSLKDVPPSLAFDDMKYLLWENTPYQNSAKFLENAYKNVNISDIEKFYSRIYYPKNTIVAVNGSVDEKVLINYFSQIFNNKNSKVYDISAYETKIPPMVKNKSKTENINSNQAWIVIAYRTPKYGNIKDWAALKVIDSILGTGMSSRLFTVLRDQQGLAYTVASIYQSNMLQGAFAIYMGTNPKNLQKAQDGLKAEISKLKYNFVSSNELEKAKERILGNYLISKETNSEKAQTMALYELYNRGYDFDNDYAEYINSVTEQDIIEAANKYFNDACVTVIVK